MERNNLEKQMVRMKIILWVAFLIASINAKAVTIINVSDTTLTSNWNAGGSILNITGKISGAYEISNAIIQANNFIQIFDTAITLGTGISCEKFSAMWYGAKPSNADNSVYLQKAINASQDRGYWLYIPFGSYKTTQPLMVIKGTYGSYQQTQIKMYGDATFWDNGSGTQIVYSGDSCALGLQLNKGSIVRNLRFTGKWVSPSGPDSTYYKITFDNYVNQSESGGNGNGIWIDPIGNWNQRSGSTGCKFYDLKIENFQTLIKFGNGISQNDEIMLFENIQLGDAKIGFQSTQPQEKGNIIKGVYSWGRIHTIFQITSGANYYIDGANIAGGCIRIFNIYASGWFPSHIQNIYAEQVGSIGSIYGAIPISISNSLFDFIERNRVGAITLLSGGGNLIKFNSCTFRYYGNSDPLKFSGAATFDNCLFSGSVTGMDNGIYTNYSNGTMNVSGTKIVTVTTDTIKTNSVKITLRKSNLSQ